MVKILKLMEGRALARRGRRAIVHHACLQVSGTLDDTTIFAVVIVDISIIGPLVKHQP